MNHDIGVFTRRRIISPAESYFAVPAVVASAQKFDPAQTTSFVNLSGGDLTATSISGATAVDGTRGVINWSTLLHYCEFTATTVSAGGCGPCIISPSFVVGTDTFGATNEGLMYFSTDGNIYLNNSSVAAASSFTSGDVLSMAVDYGNELVWFRKNGGLWNLNVAGDPTDPVTGVGIDWSVFGSSGAYPGYTFLETGQAATANFGPTYAFTPPAGYV